MQKLPRLVYLLAISRQTMEGKLKSFGACDYFSASPQWIRGFFFAHLNAIQLSLRIWYVWSVLRFVSF